MRIKNIYFILITIIGLYTTSGYTYDLIFRMQAGYNFFQMTTIKSYHQGILDNLHSRNIDAKITDDFPPFFNFQSQILLGTKSKFNFGYYIDYSSTGSRIHYKDYSGELQIDHLLHQVSHGLIVEYDLYKLYENIHFIPALKIFYSTSKLKIIDNLRILVYSYSTSSKFDAISYGFEPELGIQYFFNDFIEFKFCMAYKFNFDGELYAEKNENYYLTHYMNYAEIVTADWSGFNFSVSIGIRLKSIF